MDTIELKSDLHGLIDRISDNNVLQAVKVLLTNKSEKTDWFDDLSEEEQKLIEQGISEADDGELITHEEIMAEVKKRYNI